MIVTAVNRQTGALASIEAHQGQLIKPAKAALTTYRESAYHQRRHPFAPTKYKIEREYGPYLLGPKIPFKQGQVELFVLWNSGPLATLSTGICAT
jgi:hypothetical protein